MFCREQAVQLHREIERIHAKGAELVFVGTGNRHWASIFKQDYGITCPVCVDTERESYRALGMKRKILGILDPRLVKHGLRALKSGFRKA